MVESFDLNFLCGIILISLFFRQILLISADLWDNFDFRRERWGMGCRACERPWGRRAPPGAGSYGGAVGGGAAPSAAAAAAAGKDADWIAAARDEARPWAFSCAAASTRPSKIAGSSGGGED